MLARNLFVSARGSGHASPVVDSLLVLLFHVSHAANLLLSIWPTNSGRLK
jgi:hypothetical protein